MSHPWGESSRFALDAADVALPVPDRGLDAADGEQDGGVNGVDGGAVEEVAPAVGVGGGGFDGFDVRVLEAFEHVLGELVADDQVDEGDEG